MTAGLGISGNLRQPSAASCTSEENGDDKNGGEAGGAGGSDGATNPAVVVVGQAYTPQDYLTYVRDYPDVPECDVSFAKFREFGNANVSVNEGKIFVEQDGTMQRFSVNADLELVD